MVVLCCRCSDCCIAGCEGLGNDSSGLFQVWRMKHDTFTKCPHCGVRPATDDELVLSLAMTDHYFDLTTMKQIGAAVAEREPPNLDEKSRQDLSNRLENARKTPAGWPF